jgi:hypothetical protein
MQYLLWSSSASALIFAFIFLQSAQAPQPLQPKAKSTTPTLTPQPQPPQPSLLDRAQSSAQQDQLKQAITLADTIPPTSPQYPIAQQLRETWSRELLQRAINKYVQADLPTALKMLASIPPNTSSFNQSMQLASLWQQEKQVAQLPPQPLIPSPQTIALPSPSIQPTITSSIPTHVPPPPRISIPQVSEAVRQEDQRILEILSTTPSHWNQLQRQQAVVDSIVKPSPIVKQISPPEFSSTPQFSPEPSPETLSQSPSSTHD